MVFLSRLSLFFFLCYSSVTAGVFDSIKDMEASQETAEKLKSEILPGKIIVDSADGKALLDYSSATVVGLPEHSKTRTILSCAHTYWDCIKDDPNCRFYFRDHKGATYPIEKIVPLPPKRDFIDPNDDIAIYLLKEDIPCHPHNEIARDMPEKATLSSLSYGWMLTTSGEEYSMHNTNGANLYHFMNDFEASQNIYVQEFTADRFVKLLLGADQTYFYMAQPSSPSQIFLHDSGASWFIENSIDGYSLAAVSSVVSNVCLTDRKAADTSESEITRFNFNYFNVPLQSAVYSLTETRSFFNKLTALSPHREWIYRHCS